MIAKNGRWLWPVLSVTGLSCLFGRAIADDVSIFQHSHYTVICVIAEGTRYNGERDVERGTAFFLTNDGIAVTNSHVALDKKNYKDFRIRGFVRQNPTPPVQEMDVSLEVIERDTKLDLALLKADKPIPSSFVHVDAAKTPIPGTSLTIVGCPLGYGPSLNTAKISNVVDDPHKRWLAEGFINPGLSGSPVFNSLGRVVGIVTAGITAGTADGKPMAIPYPPGIITPFEMAESGVVARQKVKVSRATEVGDSPPIILSQVVTLTASFPAAAPGAGGGAKPDSSTMSTGQQAFAAAPGYEFIRAEVLREDGANAQILGAPQLSRDRKEIMVRYEGDSANNQRPFLDASIRSVQRKIVPKPALIQKAFDVYETNIANEGVDANNVRLRSYAPEPGYRFETVKFMPISNQGASIPQLQVSEDRKKLSLSFALDKAQKQGVADGWLIGTVIVSQTLDKAK